MSVRVTVLATVVCLLGVAAPADADVLPVPDWVLQGELCVGFDCVDGETFGADTVRLKENNTRVGFTDTSVADADNDWQIEANATPSGGPNHVGFRDQATNLLPFSVAAGAPTDAFVVRGDGAAGVGRGALLQPGDAAVENPATVDGDAVLAALSALPIGTYATVAGDGTTRRIGPQGAAFNTAFGLGDGANLATGDVAGVALAALQEIATRLPATPGARGETGDVGPSGGPGASGGAGEPGAPGAAGATASGPTAAQLAAFRKRIGTLRTRQASDGRRLTMMNRAVTKALKRKP